MAATGRVWGWLAAKGRGVLGTMVLAASVSVGARAPIPDEPAATCDWRTDFEAARQEAHRSTRLLLVCLIGDHPKVAANVAALWRDRQAIASTEDVVTVFGSLAELQGEARSLLPGTARPVACGQAARDFLFGAWENIPGLQMIVLFPNGEVAWHACDACSSSDLARALRAAKKQLAKGAREWKKAQVDAMRKLLRSAHQDDAAFHAARTMLARARLDTFAALWDLVRSRPVASRLLRDLCALPAEQADPLVLHAAQHGTANQRATATELLAELRAAEPDAPAAPAAEGEREFIIAVPEPLEALGKIEQFDTATFVDDPAVLAEGYGKITVVWYFLPDWKELSTYVARCNEFARTMADKGVRMIGLAGTLQPEQDLQRLAAMGFEFAVGVYPYAAAAPRDGVSMFPCVKVLDPDLEVVYCSHHYTEFEGLVRGLLRSKHYAPRIRVNLR
jgi:hypothetical protein